MGITVMENFDVADFATLNAAPHGVNQVNGGLNGTWALTSFTENGMRRPSITCRNDFYQGGSSATVGAALEIPIPLPASGVNIDRTYYVSFRIRLVTGSNAASMTPIMTFNHVQVYLAISSYVASGVGNSYNLANFTRGDYVGGGDATKIRGYAGPGATANTPNTQFAPDANGWFHVEVYKPAGSMFATVWINDFMYQANTATSNPNIINANTNYVRVFMGRTGGFLNGVVGGFEMTDLIVIDPTTDGQKYRFGSSARVLSMDYTADVVNQWAADPSATLTHREMMMSDRSVPLANNILTGLTVGQREQYAMRDIPAAFGPYVPAVMVRPRVMNAGASTHSVAMEMDWGSGIAEIGVKSVAAGGAYDTTPIIMTTKPNGDPWTTADFASAKAGFSVKS